MRDCRQSRRRNGAALPPPATAGPHPALRATFSHPGEGREWRGSRQTYPRPSSPALSCPRPSPKRGGRPEVCWRLGEGRRLRAGVTPCSREASGTALGTLRSLCEELAGNGRPLTIAMATTRRPAEGHWRRSPPILNRLGPISAARSPKSPEAERHGACDGWLNPAAPQPGSTVADSPRASRRSASPVQPPLPPRIRAGG